MNSIVIGIGSHIGDDQLGFYIINALAQDQELKSNQALKFVYCVDIGATLLNLIQGYNRVYLIDSVKAGKSVGTLFQFRNEEILGINHLLSSHSISLAETLKLGEVLDIIPNDIRFFGMEIGESNSFFLSSKVRWFANKCILRLKERMLEDINE